jgi:hypothetical protein
MTLSLKQLRSVLERAGVEFLDPVEGVSGAGVRLRWGVVVEMRAGGDTGEGEGGSRRKMLTAPIDAELAEYWTERPEQWAKLSESGRQALSNMMFGSAEAGDEACWNDTR